MRGNFSRGVGEEKAREILEFVNEFGREPVVDADGGSGKGGF